MNKKIKVASLFSGIGGIDLAFIKAGFNVIWANDIDKYACQTYRLNFSQPEIIEEDIRNILTNQIPDFDVLVAGFPCQAFSSVGLQKGFEDDRGNVFFEIVRIIKDKNPKCVFFENVSNLTKHDNGNTYTIISNSLEQLGYTINYKIMNASDYGIPQQRNRIYIVAIRNDNFNGAFIFPEEIPLKHNAFYYLDKERQDEKYYLDNHKKWDEIKAFMTEKDRIYRFTDWGISKGRKGICPTLLAAMGSPYERIPFFRDDFSIRKLTQREASRLQGFPDSFEFPLKKTPKQVYKQIGNSVCIPIVESIAKLINNYLNKEE